MWSADSRGRSRVKPTVTRPALLPSVKSLLLLKRNQRMTSRTRARYTTSFQTPLIMSVTVWHVIRTAIQNSTLHPSNHPLHFCPSTHAPRATHSRILHHPGLTLHTPSLKNSMYEYAQANLTLFILVPLLLYVSNKCSLM